MNPPLVIVMGVSGTGKSSCGKKLAAGFELPFIDADDLHSLANQRKMSAGEPLSNADREPWMKAVCEKLNFHAQRNVGCVLAHSALRRQHRKQLRQCKMRTLFLYLEAPREVIAGRMTQRKNHFMPVQLLDSQFEALQAPRFEFDVVRLDATLGLEGLIAQAWSLSEGFVTGGRNDALTISR